MTELCFPPASGLLSVEQAQQLILASITPLTHGETIPLSQALGRILAEDLYSPIDIPPQANAAMDGYGLAAADILSHAFSLPQIGTSWAGKPFKERLPPGCCVRIFTGAVIPEGVDSVVPQELVTRDHDQIMFPADTPRYQHIRQAGSDIQRQALLLQQGKILNASAIGLLAAAGISQINVIRRIKIGFFSSGDELTPLGNNLQFGQIYDSNRYQLAALLHHPQYEINDLGIVADDAEQLEHQLRTAALEHDVLVSTGGASVGDADFIKQSLETCGRVDLWKIAIKPGKPLAFGRIGNCLFFGLPGNPVAVLVSTEKFLKPALHRLAGGQAYTRLSLRARCDSQLRKRPGRQEYQRGILRQTADGELWVSPVNGQESHQLASTSTANCFIVLDSACANIAAGEQVKVEPLQLAIDSGESRFG